MKHAEIKKILRSPSACRDGRKDTREFLNCVRTSNVGWEMNIFSEMVSSLAPRGHKPHLFITNTITNIRTYLSVPRARRAFTLDMVLLAVENETFKRPVNHHAIRNSSRSTLFHS